MKTLRFVQLAMVGVLVSVLAACGGGAVAPTLSVSPKTQVVSAGGGAVELNAALANSSEPITWSISPSVGTLSATSGAKVSYTPPPTVGSSTTITLTASVGSLSDSASFTVNPAAAAAPTTGTLEFGINTPSNLSGFTPSLRVTGTGFNQTVTGAQPLTLAPGNYSVSILDVRSKGSVVDTISFGRFTSGGSGSTATVNIVAGQNSRLNLIYAPYASTGRLWALDSSGNGGAGFDGGDLATVGVNAGRLTARGITTPGTSSASGVLDSNFNLWVLQSDQLVQFAATDLSVLRRIALQPVNSFFGAGGMAFDAGGNLWLVEPQARRLVVYSKAALEALPTGNSLQTLAPSSQLTPVNLGGLNGLAFDAAGNAWVSDTIGSRLLRFSATQLETALNTQLGSFNVTPAQTITNTNNPLPGVARSLDFPTSLAFDKDGNLWVANLSGVANTPTILRFTNGVVSLALVGAGVAVSPSGLAFDNAGNLWVGGFAGGKSTVFKYATSNPPAPNSILQISPQASFEASVSAITHGLFFGPHF